MYFLSALGGGIEGRIYGIVLIALKK